MQALTSSHAEMHQFHLTFSVGGLPFRPDPPSQFRTSAFTLPLHGTTTVTPFPRHTAKTDGSTRRTIAAATSALAIAALLAGLSADDVNISTPSIPTPVSSLSIGGRTATHCTPSSSRDSSQHASYARSRSAKTPAMHTGLMHLMKKQSIETPCATESPTPMEEMMTSRAFPLDGIPHFCLCIA